MTHQEFINKYNGKFVEVAGSPGAENQCVDLANAYLQEVLNHPIVEWTNARDFPSKLPDFEWIENTIDALPKEGDLIIWQHNQWGHISICTNVVSQFNFKSFDQNYPTGSASHIQNHNYDSPKVAGWLRSPESKDMNDEMMEIKKSEFERLITEANEKDKVINGLEDEVSELAKQLEYCQNEGKKIKIEESIQLADKTWVVNGLQVDSDGKTTANYTIKK